MRNEGTHRSCSGGGQVCSGDLWALWHEANNRRTRAFHARPWRRDETDPVADRIAAQLGRVGFLGRIV